MGNDRVAKRSKKHHYLPRHYLRGFTDPSNLFYIYDKENDIVLEKATTPDAFFYKNELNTVLLPDGNKSDFLEKLYAASERRIWKSFNRISNTNARSIIDIQDKMNLFYFLCQLHWRLPSNQAYVDELTKHFFTDNSELSHVKLTSKTGETAPLEIIEMIRDSNGFRQTSKMLLPFAQFKNRLWSEKIYKWRFYYTSDATSHYFVGDNPIVARGIKDHDPLHCLDEFIFPVAGNILLLCVDESLKDSMPLGVLTAVNQAIISRSKRFVAFHHYDYLCLHVQCYRRLRERYSDSNIVSMMFDMLRQS